MVSGFLTSPLESSRILSGLASFTLAGHSSAAVVEQLGRQGIWIRRLDDPDCLRACTHITTTDAEIDQLLEALTALG